MIGTPQKTIFPAETKPVQNKIRYTQGRTQLCSSSIDQHNLQAEKTLFYIFFEPQTIKHDMSYNNVSFPGKSQ